MYPIIRRKRRPLVVEDVPPAVPAPVQSEPDGPPMVESEQPKVIEAIPVPQDESY